MESKVSDVDSINLNRPRLKLEDPWQCHCNGWLAWASSANDADFHSRFNVKWDVLKDKISSRSVSQRNLIETDLALRWPGNFWLHVVIWHFLDQSFEVNDLLELFESFLISLLWSHEMANSVSESVNVVHCNHKGDSFSWSSRAHSYIQNNHFNCQIDVSFVSILVHMNTSVKSCVNDARDLVLLLQKEAVFLLFKSSNNWHAIVVGLFTLFEGFPSSTFHLVKSLVKVAWTIML